MPTVFDNAFKQSLATHHSVFGEVATYTVKATGSATSIRFLIDSLTNVVEARGESRSDVWILTGSLRRTDVAQPAKGDTITLLGDSGARTYTLTQTPTGAEDLSQWDVEFRHEQALTRGGNNTFPII